MAINGTNLKLFRKRNSLKQNELAELLGITRSFISMVEKDKSKLPKDKLAKLLALSGANGWDVEALLPEYARLMIANKYLEDNGKSIPLTTQTIDNLRLGEEEFSSEIAETISAAYPSINSAWLLTGEGSMLTESKESELADIRSMLVKALAELENNKRQLTEMKELLSELIVSRR